MKLSLEEAKSRIAEELKSVHADVHYPLNNKYGRWKVIDYLWAYYKDRSQPRDGSYKDFLIEKYKEAGMTEEEKSELEYGIELIMEAFNRTQQNSINK